MKTKEFREAIEKFAKVRGFIVKEDSGYITMRESYSEGLVVDVEIGVQYAIDTIGTGFESLEPDAREHLMNYIVFPYMKTPLEEREEEKKYVVEIKTTDSTLHLWRATDGSGDTDFISKNRITTGQRHFTEKEIESIDDRFLQFAIEGESE